MTGQVVQINVSRGGLPKRSISRGVVTPLGLEGDLCAHPEFHGGPRQALLLIAAETVDELAGGGFPVFYGALGENITTRGIDRRQLRVGHQLRLGTALIELTKVRVPCATLDVYGPGIQRHIYDKQVKEGDADSPRWGKSGFYASVLEPGEVYPDDRVELVSVLA